VSAVRDQLQSALLTKQLRQRALDETPIPSQRVTIGRIKLDENRGGVSTLVAILIGVAAFAAGAYTALFVVSQRR
jgi:hypothetical protein